MKKTPHLAIIANLSFRSSRMRLDAFAKEARTLGWPLRLLEISQESYEGGAYETSCQGLFICNADLSTDFRRALENSKLPIVEASRKISAPWPQVFVDEEALTRLAVAHFRILQRRHFAYLGRNGHCGSVERESAFRIALPKEAETYAAADLSMDDARMKQSLLEFLKELPLPACLLCHEDRIATAVTEACDALQIDIPCDLAVLSCGDDPLLNTLGFPGVSSIVFPAESIGRESARILDRLIRTQEKPEAVIRIPPEDVHIRGSTDESASEDPILAKAVEFMRQHLSEPLSTDSIARHAGISRRGLEVRFREKLDMTVQDYIRKRRMMEAAFLLRSTNLTLETISERCGYTTASSFSRAFKSIHGASPSHLRDSSL